MDNKLPIITAEYYPMIPRESIAASCKHKISLNDLSSLGANFSAAAAAIAGAVANAPSAEGLYRCVFPEGVTGHLAKFRDGSGFTGTIMNGDGIAAQARWVPAEGKAATIPINPVVIAVAVAVKLVTKKLDTIAETQEEILQFLQKDKESELEGAVNSLSEIMTNYRFNSDNEMWRGSQLTVVTTIKGKAEHNIIFFRKAITSELGKQKLFHSTQKASKMKAELERNLKYYQLAVYLYAYGSFLEVILGGQYSKGYLDHVSEKLQEYAMQYRVDYSECYTQLEGYAKSSLQSKLLEGVGIAGKGVGGAIAKIPIISKGPVDEALIAAGEKVGKYGEKRHMKFMTSFDSNRDASIQLFFDNIDEINRMSNHPVELLFDRNTVYVCT